MNTTHTNAIQDLNYMHEYIQDDYGKLCEGDDNVDVDIDDMLCEVATDNLCLQPITPKHPLLDDYQFDEWVHEHMGALVHLYEISSNIVKEYKSDERSDPYVGRLKTFGDFAKFMYDKSDHKRQIVF